MCYRYGPCPRVEHNGAKSCSIERETLENLWEIISTYEQL